MDSVSTGTLSLPTVALFSAELVTPFSTIPGGAYPASLWFLDRTESILVVLELHVVCLQG